MNGYFQLSLLVRREQDEVYVKLGDLMVRYGTIPFLPGVNIPVIKAPVAVLSRPDVFKEKYHQYQLWHEQFLLRYDDFALYLSN